MIGPAVGVDAFPSPMTHRGNRTFSVATYNIHSCIGIDGRFDPERVVRAIGEIDADVVALQEVGWHLRGARDFDQFSYLAEKTGYAVHAGLTKDHSDAQFGNALLTRHELLELRLIDLSMPFHVPRGAIDADLAINGIETRVINVHLGLGPWERWFQIKRILNAIALSPPLPTVLLGDFNHWGVSERSIDKIRTYLPNLVIERTFHTRVQFVEFDRIFLSADLTSVEEEVLKTPNTRYASDHLPLRANVRYTRATASPAVEAANQA